MYRLTAFALGSVGLLVLSRKSLQEVRSHGFYRFFAFECLLGLVVMNAGGWFANPFSALQMASWVLLSASLLLAGHGFYLLRRVGHAGRGIEGTVNLVRTGAYRYVRHPLYASLLYLGWGAFLKGASPITGALVLGASAFLVATAKIEEKENLGTFGEEYRTYMTATKMFLPFVI